MNGGDRAAVAEQAARRALRRRAAQRAFGAERARRRPTRAMAHARRRARGLPDQRRAVAVLLALRRLHPRPRHADRRSSSAASRSSGIRRRATAAPAIASIPARPTRRARSSPTSATRRVGVPRNREPAGERGATASTSACASAHDARTHTDEPRFCGSFRTPSLAQRRHAPDASCTTAPSAPARRGRVLRDALDRPRALVSRGVAFDDLPASTASNVNDRRRCPTTAAPASGRASTTARSTPSSPSSRR